MKSEQAVLRVERGRADREELAALTAVLLALRASGQTEPEPVPTLGWNWWTSPNSYAPPGSWR